MLNPFKIMPLMLKGLLLSSLLALSGCASLNLDDASDGNFRDTEREIAGKLAMPPNLISPAQLQDRFYTAISGTEQIVVEHIPTYQAQGLQIKSNLTERWLEMDTVNSQEVWLGVQKFLTSFGMQVKEARKDIGIITTEFTPRKELVPLDSMGPITRLLNAWRAEFATGAYDRLTARVETNIAQGVTRVYFYHYVIFTATDADGDTVLGNARIKPFNPLFEAEALYQAMIFFGAGQADALQQIKITEYRMEMVEGTAFAGVKLRANLNESWTYLKSMLFRANWLLEKADINNYQAWVKVPEQARQEPTIASRLAFWRDEDERNVPERIKFRLELLEDDSGNPVVPVTTVLTVSSLEGDIPLNEKNREYIFNKLGFIAR